MTGDQRVKSDSPTKLVYLINSLYTGGAEIGLCRLLQGLDSERYDVTVVALQGHEPELVNRIPDWATVVDLEFSRRPNLPAVRVLIHSLWDADVIVGSLYHAALLARFTGALNRTVTVATWQHNELFKNDLRQWSFEKTIPLNDVVLADSKPVSDFLKQSLDVPDNLVHTVPIAGIDIQDYTTVSHRKIAPVVVGSVGRIVEQKNYTTLLDVASELSAREIRFEVAGSGEQLEFLRQQADSRGLSNVKFKGSIPSVPDFLATLDIYFQPSRHEGLCITVLEAMAAGLPVVGSNVAGIGQSVRQEESGLLYEPGDVQGFADGISELASDPERREKLGIEGRNVVSEKYTRESLVTEFERAIGTY